LYFPNCEYIVTCFFTISLGTFVIVYQFASGLMDAAQGLFQFVMQISGRMALAEY
jgi:hypothetical protein